MRKPAAWSSSGLILFFVVVLALGVEYVKLPLELSIFKVLIVPLCLIGLGLVLRDGFEAQWLTLFLPLLSFVFLLLLSFVFHRQMKALTTALGLVPFLGFVFFAVVQRGWPPIATWALSFWSVPHLATLVLWRAGLWNEAYTDSTTRFDGLHFDPNLMSVFLLASFSAKATLMSGITTRKKRVWLLAWMATDVLMIGLSGSRGGLVGLLLLLLTWLFVRKGLVPALLAFLVAVVLVFGSAQLFIHQGLSELAHNPVAMTLVRFMDLEGKDNTSDSRLMLWTQAAKTIREEGLVIGYTTDRFMEENHQYPHNTFIDAALECGVAGALLLLGILIHSAAVLLLRTRGASIEVFQGLLLGVAFWGSLLFLSAFTAKAFWLSVAVPYAISLRVQAGRTHRIVEGDSA